MPIQPNIVDAFAESIFAKASLLREGSLTEHDTKRVKESISDDIKKCTDCTTPRVSVAAQMKADELKVNLADMGWHNQTRFDKGRHLFHREHTIPVRDIREKCLNAQSIDVIKEALHSAKVAWILKSEDRKLTALGYRTNRSDPVAAYQEAGIILQK